MLLLWIHRSSSRYYPTQVIPFGNLRVKACLPLSVAYRSLPRPSSPIGTKASMMRSLWLDQSVSIAAASRGWTEDSLITETLSLLFSSALISDSALKVVLSYYPVCRCQRTSPDILPGKLSAHSGDKKTQPRADDNFRFR